MLKVVPKGLIFVARQWHSDPRSRFFREAKNQGKEYYYYRLIDGNNKLQPLGLFKQIMYGAKFDRFQFENTINDVPEVKNTDNLYYSDEPLTDNELYYENNPEIKSIITSYGYGGKKYIKSRKSKKSRKSRKSKKSKKSRKSRKSKK